METYSIINIGRVEEEEWAGPGFPLATRSSCRTPNPTLPPFPHELSQENYMPYLDQYFHIRDSIVRMW
jgi:hypothetical protein